MNLLTDLSTWFTGGDPGYMKLSSCMRHDTLWIAITVALDALVAAGYVLIAMHWWKNERVLPDVPAKRALGNMRNIFIFCGLCGYLFIPVKMIWPAWRLYDMFMVVLAYFTWRYALGARDLKVVYNELGRSTRLAADLEQSRQESAEKTFFLNAISHDLRTPLNGLVLQAEVAEISAASNDVDSMRQAVTEMKTSARSAARLLDSLLEYAQLSDALGAGKGVSAFDLGDALRGVVESFRRRADAKGLSLQVRAPQGVAVSLERTALERILANLLDNALKFTDRGGIRVEAETDGTGLEIHVLDTGIGIAPEHQGRLFDEFFQVGNAHRDRANGFGLGLAIARRLARQLGGDVTVDSAPGSGSRFTVALPRAARPAELASGDARGDAALAAAGGTRDGAVPVPR